MLLWEALTLPREGAGTDQHSQVGAPLVPRRLPYDTRCATVTKSGKRCRGKVRGGGEHCPLHDPATVERRRNQPTPRKNLARRRLMNLPDGYLRKLSDRAAVGNAMDRLYRELRLGIVSIEMGQVMFRILTRLLDAGLIESGKAPPKTNGRSKVDRLRPRLAELLTLGERRAWRRAVASAPVSVARAHEPARPTAGLLSTRLDEPQGPDRVEATPKTVPLQAAS